MDTTATLDRRTLLRGAAGATAAAAGGAAATGSGAAQSTQEIVVGPSDNITSFSPDSVTVEPGTEVTFVWESDGHNVAVESQPDGAGWEGHEPIEDTGFEFSHTFDTEGTYEYVCEPHINAGMEGSIEVSADAGQGGGAAGPPEVPASAMSLTTGLIGALVSVVALAFYFLKYGGTDEE